MRRRSSREEDGQSTVEHALVLVAFLSALLGMSALWRWVSGGGLLDLALSAASHVWGGGGLVGLSQDLLLY